MPKGITVHHADLSADDISMQEGLPVTTIERTITDLLQSGGRTDLLKQAISDARREGYISDAGATKLRRRIESHLKLLRTSPKTLEPKLA